MINTAFTDLDFHLDNWARWMCQKEGPEGLPQRASGGIVGYSGMDREGAHARLDQWLAEHADAAIHSLVPAERAAVYQFYRLSCVWRFPMDDYEAMLLSARGRIRTMLIARGVVVT